MEYFLLVTIITFALGTEFSLATNIFREGLFPVAKFIDYPVLDREVRRMRAACTRDMELYGIWCLYHEDNSCSGFKGFHSKWMVEIDHNKEWMCFPSSCSSNDLTSYYTSSLESLNTVSKYCSLDCPLMEFNVIGTGEHGQSISINGMYNYADVSYDCAGAFAHYEIQLCPDSEIKDCTAKGWSLCRYTWEDSLKSEWVTTTTKGNFCVPHECTDDSNVEKLEDFFLAALIYAGRQSYSLYQMRKGYQLDVWCPDRPGDDRNSDDEDSSSHADEDMSSQDDEHIDEVDDPSKNNASPSPSHEDDGNSSKNDENTSNDTSSHNDEHTDEDTSSKNNGETSSQEDDENTYNDTSSQNDADTDEDTSAKNDESTNEDTSSHKDDDKASKNEENTSQQKSLNYVGIFGITSAVLVLGAIGILVVVRRRKVVMPPAHLEMNSPEAVAVELEGCGTRGPSHSASSLDYVLPMQTNVEMQSGERDEE